MHCATCTLSTPPTTGARSQLPSLPWRTGTLAAFSALGKRPETRAQTAIRYALSHPDLSCAIVGIADLDQLDEALAAQALGPLPAGTMTEIEHLQDNHPAFVNHPERS